MYALYHCIAPIYYVTNVHRHKAQDAEQIEFKKIFQQSLSIKQCVSWVIFTSWKENALEINNQPTPSRTFDKPQIFLSSSTVL